MILEYNLVILVSTCLNNDDRMMKDQIAPIWSYVLTLEWLVKFNWKMCKLCYVKSSKISNMIILILCTVKNIFE